ncbi:MAG TPA: HEAT repeat domain-containing protein [Tepidisphaeraceae bacterium]|jgi:HEAT repeat protein|nr:HEAT repeat domain-containing protein [Tepidisphaeraceae bacterium]
MKKIMLAALAIVLTAAVGGRAQETDFTDIVKDLAQKLGGQDNYARGEAATMLEMLCNQASRPGANQDRAAICKAMAKAVGKDTPKMGRVWLLRQIEKNGRAEVVDVLAGLLNDQDALVRQHALLALANNPSDEAGAKLREALENAEDSQARVAVINALGYRRDAKSVTTLAKWLQDDDVRVASSALAALGSIANSEALAAMEKLEDLNTRKELRNTGLDAYLRCMERLAQGEKQAEAADFYFNLYESGAPKQQKLAGLRGAALSSLQEKAVAALLDALANNDLQIQLTAAQLAAQAGPQVASKILDSFDRLPPASQAALLVALADRGIASAKDKAQNAIKSSDSTVRVAALQALGSLGDASTAMMLAELAAEKTGAEQTTARESIAKIRGTDVDAVLLAFLPRSNTKARAELVRGLAARRAMPAIPTLENLAKSDPDISVRVESINALGAIASPNSLSSLLDILLTTKDQKESQAAESAAAAVLFRIDNANDRAAPLLSSLSTTAGAQRMALLRLLGRTGSPTALHALREELKTGAPEMHNATIRALSEWPDAAVIPDLLTIAREDPAQTNKVLALRGYVRVVALPTDRRPAETARMLGDALAIAPPNEKKSILGALGAVGDVGALRLAAPLMDDEEVRTEAITATLRIARALAGTATDEATTAANHALKLSQDEAVKRNVAAILQAADRARDFVTDWFVAGPYMEDGKDKNAVFDLEFPPEKSADAKWVKMPPNPDRGRFWEMNLDAVDNLRGENRAAYLRTQIYVPKAQELQLEVGSDDAIKVWINGNLVHSNNASRGDDPGQDKIKVKLDEGWNKMMLKVINGGGGWGANARLRTLNDKKVTGMKVKAE